jgi:DNA ligase D-like protein (predicted ligase)
MRIANYITPMLCKSQDEPFDGAEWIFEIKWDGYRAVAHTGKAQKLYSRNGLSFEHDYPGIWTALKQFKTSAIMDGEIVALDNKGRPSFQLLQQYKTDPSIDLIYYVFDLLSLNGKDLTSLPLLERKQMLQTMLGKYKHPYIRYSDHIETKGKQFFRMLGKKGLEGMIAKRETSHYVTGKRTGDWLKIKHVLGQEVVIAGFTAPRGSRKFFGSLLLGVYEKGKFIYVGHAGTGFTEQSLADLHKKMTPLITNENPFGRKVPANSPVTWVKPKLVANVKFTEWTSDGAMRHPVFLGLRKDKAAKEVVKE